MQNPEPKLGWKGGFHSRICLAVVVEEEDERFRVRSRKLSKKLNQKSLAQGFCRCWRCTSKRAPCNPTRACLRVLPHSCPALQKSIPSFTVLAGNFSGCPSSPRGGRLKGLMTNPFDALRLNVRSSRK